MSRRVPPGLGTPPRLTRALLLGCTTLALAAVPAGASTPSSTPPWSLTLTITTWTAPSTYLATITAQRRGPKIILGKRVTLRLDRHTRCGAPAFPCRDLRPRVAGAGGLSVQAQGSFEANTHGGPIAFRARTIVVRVP
jgi:hypothetical protein